jgi:hypothetical protein
VTFGIPKINLFGEIFPNTLISKQGPPGYQIAVFSSTNRKVLYETLQFKIAMGHRRSKTTNIMPPSACMAR